MTSQESEYIRKWFERLKSKWEDNRQTAAIRHEMTEFIINTHAHIENMSVEIIADRIIDDRFSEDARSYVDHNMSQSHREMLLYECDLLPSSVQSDLSEFRQLRNEVVHRAGQPPRWELDDATEKMEAGVQALSKLADISSK